MCRKPVSQHPGLRNSLQKSQIWLLEATVYTSRLSTEKPICCNDHIHHVHVLYLLNLDFSIVKGVGCGGKGVIKNNYSLLYHVPKTLPNILT